MCLNPPSCPSGGRGGSLSSTASGATGLEREPADDGGAEAQRSFRFQWEVIARYCFRMLCSGEIAYVICEYHEDVVVVYGNRPIELVSVKHRDRSRGPWKITETVGDVLAPLLQKWIRTGRTATCSFVTDGGLSHEPGNVRDLGEACASRDAARIRFFAQKWRNRLGAATVEEAADFLSALTLDGDLPDRNAIKAMNCQQLMPQVNEKLALSMVDTDRTYESIVGVIELANRGDIVTRDDLSNLLLDPDRASPEARRRHMVESRTVNAARLRAAIFASRETSSPLLGRPSAAQDSSMMLKKLRRGGLGPTAQRSAIELRASWYDLEARYRTDLPGIDPTLDDLRTRVRRWAGEAEAEAMAKTESAPYGPEMLLRMTERVSLSRFESQPPIALTDDHLLGLVYQLTDECAIWWSDEFDPADE